MSGFNIYKEGYRPYDTAKYIKGKFAEFNINWMDLEGTNPLTLCSLEMSKEEANRLLGEIQNKYPEVGDAVKIGEFVYDPADKFRLVVNLNQISSIYLHDLKEKRKTYTKEATAELLFSSRGLPKDIGRKIGEYIAKDVRDTFKKKTDTKVGLTNKAIHKSGMDAVKEKYNKNFRKKK